MKIALFGASGFIGKSLLEYFNARKHEVVVFSRNPQTLDVQLLGKARAIKWSGENTVGWTHDLEGCRAVVNLCGEGVAKKRWTQTQKQKIRESRIRSTRAIVDAIASLKLKPEVLINASAVGIYGNVPEGDVVEATKAGKGFLAETCVAWEEEAKKVSASNVRLVLLRIGVVLEKGGGALERMLLPFKMFVGGPLGGGQQWFPWVHRDDILGMVEFAIQNPNISGPMNASSPNPLRLKEFCKELGVAVGRPSWAPVPSFVLKVMLGEMADLLLTGQKVMPARFIEAGYPFQYVKAREALKAILK